MSHREEARDMVLEELCRRVLGMEARLQVLEQARRGNPKAATVNTTFAEQLNGTPESDQRLFDREEQP